MARAAQFAPKLGVYSALLLSKAGAKFVFFLFLNRVLACAVLFLHAGWPAGARSAGLVRWPTEGASCGGGEILAGRVRAGSLHDRGLSGFVT
jgi:hypothetical protein